MADNEEKQSGAAGGANKQKVIAVLLVIVVIFIGWQVKGLMGGGSVSSEPSTPPPAPQPTNMANAAKSAPGQPNMPMNQPAPGYPAQPEQPQVRPASVPVDNAFLKMQKEHEEKYVNSLNQLQMLRIQREIAETNQAIASATLATVTAEKGVSDILTKPSQEQQQPSQPSTPPPSLAGQTIPTALMPPPKPVKQETLDVPYSVISVTMEFNKWNAVLQYQDKMYSVSLGDILPLDSSKVVSINKNGVTLEKDGKKRKLTIVTSI